MAEPTPGHWIVGRDTETRLPVVMAKDGPVLAEVTQWGNTEANATLIAAAPSLLEAAQALSNHVLQEHGRQLNYDSCAVCSVSINELDRAIEKATGEVLTWGEDT